MIDDGDLSGIAVDLWKEIAASHHWAYEFVRLPLNVKDCLDQVEAHKIDVLLGPFSLTYHRRPTLRVSSPYTIAHIMLLVTKRPMVFWWTLKKIIFSISNLTVFACVLLFFVFIHLYWILERGKSEKIKVSYKEGILHLFWNYLLTDGTQSLPTTNMGRVLMLLWMIVKTVIASSVVAIVMSAVTLSYTLSTESVQPDDQLSDKRIAYIAGGVAEALLHKKESNVGDVAVSSLQKGIAALSGGKVDGFAGILSEFGYYLKHHPSHELVISSIMLQHDLLSFILPRDSPYAEDIDDDLSLMRRDGFAAEVCSRYLTPDMVMKNCVF